MSLSLTGREDVMEAADALTGAPDWLCQCVFTALVSLPLLPSPSWEATGTQLVRSYHNGTAPPGEPLLLIPPVGCVLVPL